MRTHAGDALIDLGTGAALPMSAFAVPGLSVLHTKRCQCTSSQQTSRVSVEVCVTPGLSASSQYRPERIDQRRTFRVSADADAQELVDARTIEVAHEDSALTQFSCQPGAVVLRMARNSEQRPLYGKPLETRLQVKPVFGEQIGPCETRGKYRGQPRTVSDAGQ